MTITQESLQALADQISEIDSRCRAILELRRKNLNGVNDWFWGACTYDHWEVAFCGNGIDIQAEGRWSNGSRDEDELFIPFEDFCADDWQERCTERFEEAAMEHKREQDQTKRRADEQARAQRQRQYEDLKKEFGG